MDAFFRHLLLPDPGAFGSAEGHLSFPADRRRVDVDHPYLDVFGEPHRSRDVVGVDGAGETEGTVIGRRDHRIVVFYRENGEHRPEDLFLPQPHRGLYGYLLRQ